MAQHSAAQHVRAAHARHTILARTRTTYTCRAQSCRFCLEVPRCLVVHTMQVLLVCAGLSPALALLCCSGLGASLWRHLAALWCAVPRSRWLPEWHVDSGRFSVWHGTTSGTSVGVYDDDVCGFSTDLLARLGHVVRSSAEEWRPLRGVRMSPDARRVRVQRRHPREYCFGGLCPGGQILGSFFLLRFRTRFPTHRCG